MTRVIVTSVLLPLLAAPLAAQELPKKPSALDQELLEGLDRDLLGGLPGTKPAAPNAQPGPSQSPPLQSDHPLAQLAGRMREVEARLAQQDTSKATQGQQQQILDQLAKLLEQARQQQASGQNKSGSGRGMGQAGTGTGDATPGPPRDSTNRIEQGTPEQVETADVKDLFRRIWGHLPEKLRDEMQASLSEQFLPKYERVIEEYYKRLAEERPGGP